MKCINLCLAMFVIGILWSRAVPRAESDGIPRLETGVTTYQELRGRLGQGELIGGAGTHCGAMRSRYEMPDEQLLVVSWDRGRVCDWQLSPAMAARAGAAPSRS